MLLAQPQDHSKRKFKGITKRWTPFICSVSSAPCSIPFILCKLIIIWLLPCSKLFNSSAWQYLLHLLWAFNSWAVWEYWRWVPWRWVRWALHEQVNLCVCIVCLHCSSSFYKSCLFSMLCCCWLSVALNRSFYAFFVFLSSIGSMNKESSFHHPKPPKWTTTNQRQVKNRNRLTGGTNQINYVNKCIKFPLNAEQWMGTLFEEKKWIAVSSRRQRRAQTQGKVCVCVFGGFCATYIWQKRPFFLWKIEAVIVNYFCTSRSLNDSWHCVISNLSSDSFQ